RALQRFHEPALNNILGGALASVSEVAVVDSASVDFLTSEVSALIPQALGRVPIALSPDDDIQAVPVGTGPFRPVAITDGGEVTLERFSDYWGNAALPDRVVFKPVTSEADRLRAVVNGDVHLATAIAPGRLSASLDHV